MNLVASDPSRSSGEKDEQTCLMWAYEKGLVYFTQETSALQEGNKCITLVSLLCVQVMTPSSHC